MQAHLAKHAQIEMQCLLKFVNKRGIRAQASGTYPSPWQGSIFESEMLRKPSHRGNMGREKVAIRAFVLISTPSYCLGQAYNDVQVSLVSFCFHALTVAFPFIRGQGNTFRG